MTQRIELIPAIDIIEGQCVRLTKGDYGQKTVYGSRPAEVAREFERLGFSRLHILRHIAHRRLRRRHQERKRHRRGL